MLKMRLGFIVCLFIVSCGGNFCYAQQFARASKDKDLAAMRLENVRIEAQGVRQLFSRLSLSYDIPVGLEVAAYDDEVDIYRIDFKNGTLSDFLTQFVTENSRYAWTIGDGVVNVFPKDNYRNPILQQILTTEISSFSVKKKTSCWTLARSLASTTEIRRTLGLHGITYSPGDPSGFYIQQLGEDFTLDVSNVTLKSILNKVIKESPVAKFWLIKKHSYNQTFSLDLSARFENSPINKGKSEPLHLNVS